MNTTESKDYSKLSKDELIVLLTKRDSMVSELSGQNAKLSEENALLASEKADLKAEVADLKKLLALKEAIIKRMNLEKFADHSDNANMHFPHAGKTTSPSGRDVGKKESKGKAGRKTGSKNFSDIDFEKRSEGNEVISNDILPEWMKEHPDSRPVKIGEDVSYVIEYVKAKYICHKVVTPKYRTEEGIIQAPSRAVINHSYAGASVISALVTAKYSLGIPVYRMEGMMEEQGFPVGLNTVYGWLMKAGKALKPVHESLLARLSDGTFTSLHIDETTLRVMETCDETRKKSYMFIYDAEKDGKKVRLFDFTNDRRTDRTEELLKGFKGHITVDGYSGYDRFAAEDISIQRCLAHARRKFTDICKVLSDEQRENSSAYKAVRLIDALFAKEREFREKGLDAVEILRERRSEEYQKLADDADSYIACLDGQNLSEDLRRAVRYYMNRREEFWTYLEDGELTPDNNGAERAAKSFAASRRSFLFCRSEESADACAVLVSLVKCAEVNGLYPDMYISWCLERIRDGADPSSLMPWAKECERFRIPGAAKKKK